MYAHASWKLSVFAGVTFATILAFPVFDANAQTFEHQQCYKIRDEAKVLVRSAVTPRLIEFAPVGCNVVGRGKMFCVPAKQEVVTFEDKSGRGMVQTLVAGQQLQYASICYRLRCSLPPGPDEALLVSDPFGIRFVSRFKHHMLCAPAMIGILPDSACGTFLFKWGEPGKPSGEMSAPHGIAIDPGSSSVYVADLGNDRIQSFTLNGDYQRSWGSFGTLEGQFDGPHGVAVAQGQLFVTDVGNNRVQVFNGDEGTFQRTWGVFGTGDGQFDGPQAIATGPAGVVYVADTGNHRIQRFSNDGTFEAKWGVAGTADGEFMFPLGIHITAEGNVLVSDSGNNRIQVFDSSGVHQDTWGTQGSGEVEFFGPEGISSDVALGGTTRNIYVADLENSRVQVLDSSGGFVAQWGTIGNGNGEFHIAPHALASTEDGTIYVVDTGNARIQTFSCPAE